MKIEELQTRVDALYLEAQKKSVDQLTIGRAVADLNRARECGNAAWELRMHAELRDLQARRRESERAWSEFRKAKADLDRYTDPKAPGYTGPIFDDTAEVTA